MYPHDGKNKDDDKDEKKKKDDKVKVTDGEIAVDKIIVQDWELDFTLKENVDSIIKKYQSSRKNFVPEDQIKTLLVMEEVLKGDQ